MSRSPNPTYRVYCHDGVNMIVSAEWIEARSDEEAIAAVEAEYPGLQCELWEGDRLVATIGAERRTG